MRILRSAVIVGILFTFCSGLYAQSRCATVEYQKQNRASGKVFETEKQFEKALAEKIRARKKSSAQKLMAGVPYRIPVVVHIIHNGEAEGTGRNISDAQIISQIEVLNKDFNRLNTDAANTPAQFASVAGSLNIEFILAKQDPLGSCTNGIVRVNGNRDQWSLGMESEFKALSYWPAEDYLNIWVIKFQSYIGYAQFPVSSTLPGLEDENNNALTDGIIIDYRAFGTIDAGAFELDDQYNRGRSTTHEIGHFLGLRHIWGDEVGCSAEGDYVADTPNQGKETYHTPSHPLADICSAAIMFQNYMDYTDDISMNLFTWDQVDRMITVLENSPRRNSLLISHGLDEPTSMESIDLALSSVDPLEVITCNNRTDRNLLTFKIINLGPSSTNELTYFLSVNQELVAEVNQAVTFINHETTLSIASLPGLTLGENAISLTIRSGCDPNLANNSLALPVTLVDTDCKPYAIYIQADGQTVITFDLAEQTAARVNILNMTGQLISSTSIPQAANDTYPLSVNEGAYIIRVQIGSSYYSTKVHLHR